MRELHSQGVDEDKGWPLRVVWILVAIVYGGTLIGFIHALI
jgi:hypothetical protein